MKNNIIGIEVGKEYIFHVDKLLERSKTEIIAWFESPLKEFKVNTYIYKDIESLREGLKRRGLGLYPAQMVACTICESKEKSISRSLNFYDASKKNPQNKITKKAYDQIIYHELVLYIIDILYGNLPEWLTKGIAKTLDGSYRDDIKELMSLINTYEIPNISDMKGDFFILKKYLPEKNNSSKELVIYNGYDLSYLIIRYILEFHGKSYLLNLLSNQKSLKEIEQTILSEAIAYYNCQ